MFGLLVLIALLLPLVALPGMAVLIVALRRRWLRAGLCAVAMILIALTQFREVAYSFGFPIPYDGDYSALRRLAMTTERYLWQILTAGALTVAALAWPLPASWALRLLSLVVVGSLAIAAVLMLMLEGLNFN